MSSHTHGLALDWMAGATVVLANSTVVHCSETENADLFWALRGAGSSFGVVTEYEFRTFAAPDEVTYFSASLDWNKTTAVPGWKAFQSYAENTMPAELNMRLAVSNFDSHLEGLYYGNALQLAAALEPLLSVANGNLTMSKTTGWLEQLEFYAYGTLLNQTHPVSDAESLA
jgi:FAD/FMN-containing dehydrogenase